MKLRNDSTKWNYEDDGIKWVLYAFQNWFIYKVWKRLKELLPK